MPKIDIDKYIEDELEAEPGTRIHRKKRRLTQREKIARLQTERLEKAEKLPVDVHQGFKPSFRPARHESAWLISYLEEFYNSQVISDILERVRGGKEANVYCCAAHPSTGMKLIAAKVYRPAMFRNLRNDALYREGRLVLNEHGKPVHTRREALAIQKNTRFGQELRHVSWLETEFQTMQRLYEAGVDVPRPIAHNNNVILMEYIGEEKSPAPTLNQVQLNRSEANNIFERLMQNLELMLACQRIHADFSAYNILYWEGKFKIIDFPQAVDPQINPQASALFERDVERLCQYFERYGVHHNPFDLASKMWSRIQVTGTLQ
jgi:RIO kinase 1